MRGPAERNIRALLGTDESNRRITRDCPGFSRAARRFRKPPARKPETTIPAATRKTMLAMRWSRPEICQAT